MKYIKLSFLVSVLAIAFLIAINTTAQDTTIRRAANDTNSIIVISSNAFLRSFNPSQFTTNGGRVSITNGVLLTNATFGAYIISNTTPNSSPQELRISNTNWNTSVSYTLAASNGVNFNIWSSNLLAQSLSIGGWQFQVSPSDTNGNIFFADTLIATLNGNASRDNNFDVGGMRVGNSSQAGNGIYLMRIGSDGPQLVIDSDVHLLLGGGGNTTLLDFTTQGKSSVETKGSFGNTSITVSGGGAAYVPSDVDHIIYIVSSGGAKTVTLPNANTCSGRTYEIKDKTGNAAANNITVGGGGSNIDGAATRVMNVNFQNLMLRSDGTNWFVH